MNLPLHFGFLGVVEAGLIALLLGMVAYAVWRWLAMRFGWSAGRAIGWACVSALVVGAGLDAWNLFYLGFTRLESPLYARLALASIHDADSLGARVLCEVVGALSGVAIGYAAFNRHSDESSVGEVGESGANRD
ncbi:hypothetical protein CSC70_05980 [Pseudoxanthomonas kalamensis DSM 18571]|uniref:hypothetical protein n=1 Tax=Pseudoxanthomonas kalamensis TaxID=289483 RepID=UPI001391A61D|nr:hypothetical protein [Pseudoxanthomonas kalamensis]KAF1711449.1 hypothetical protein CSC70_05980 [Pseudoxanthomonas kalamensis DSM 18571]